MTVHELSRTDARCIAVRAQLLDSSRPAELLDVVRQLALLQIDPTAAITANADLVAWSRLGSSYSPAQLTTALENRTLLELRATIRPSEDLALYRAEMAQWPGHGTLFDKAMAAAVDHEIKDLAHWLELDLNAACLIEHPNLVHDVAARRAPARNDATGRRRVRADRRRRRRAAGRNHS